MSIGTSAGATGTKPSDTNAAGTGATGTGLTEAEAIGTTGPRLIGGEMPGWSATGPGERPPACGTISAHLLGLLAAAVPAGGRVLFAGPHDAALLDRLPQARVACLLRSLPDAAALHDRSGVEVLCGTLPKLTAPGTYDMVVALDGLDRLCSAEGTQDDWAGRLAALRRVLRPGGVLLLHVENDLGVHRLVAPSAATSPGADGAWNPTGEFDPSRPGNPGALVRHLNAEGLAVSWVGAAWGAPEAPAVVATPAVLIAPDGPVGALTAAVARGVTAAYAGRRVLSDPRRLAAAAVRGGLGAEFATSWLVLAHRTPTTADRPVTDRPAADPTAVDRPAADPTAADLTVADRPGLPAVLVDNPPQEFSRDPAGGWIRRAVGVGPGGGLSGLDPAPGGTVVRRPLAVDGPLPAGRPVEELLLAAALRHDLPAARRLLTGYAAWLASLPAGHAFATVDNVLLDGDTFTVFDPSWDTAAPVPAPVAITRALRRFATLLIHGGYAHPWPCAPDLDSLTTVLVGAAGIHLDPGLLTAAVAVDVEITAATGPARRSRVDIDEPAEPRPTTDHTAAPGEVADRQAAPGEVTDRTAATGWVRDPVTGALLPGGVREREDLLLRLRRQLADAAALAEWSAAEIARRDVELRRARAQIAVFSGSAGYRLSRLGIAVARRGVRLARRGLRAARHRLPSGHRRRD